MATRSLTHKRSTGLALLFILTVTATRAAEQIQSDSLSKSWPTKTTAPQPSIVFFKNCAFAKNPASGLVENFRCNNLSEKRSSTTAEPAPQSTAADEWQFQFSPYFWMAGLHGSTGTPNRSVQLNEGFSDVFHTLKFAFMGVFEARKDKWVIVTDVEYVSLEDDKATPGPLFSSVNAGVKTFIFNPEVGYRFFEDPDKGYFVEVGGGVRIWRISTDFTFSPGILPGTQADAGRTWVDGVAGMQGKAALSKKVFLTGKFDLGGGGSKFTYRLFGGAGYNVTPRIPLIFGYRVLDVDYDRDNFVYDINQRGPIVGMGFKF